MNYATSGTNAPARHRIGSLDGLRGIFALTVMVGHFALFQSHFQSDLFKNVALCVQFFFILSGFALSYGFMERMGSGTVSFRSFAWQRLVRLYPMHIVSMVAAGFFMPVLMQTVSPSGTLATDTILNLLLLQCVGIVRNWSWNIASWSISTEFWVGLAVLPIAFKMLSARASFALSIAGYALLLFTLGTVRTQYNNVVPGLSSAVVSTASGLLMGTALFRWARSKAFHVSLGASSRLAVGVIEASLLAAVIYIASLAIHGDIEFFCIAMMPFIIFSVATSQSWFASLLGSKPFLWLGHISYSLYLLHIPILGALTLAGLNDIDSMALRFVIFAAAVAACSQLAYRFVEMPLYARLRRIFSEAGPRLSHGSQSSTGGAS